MSYLLNNIPQNIDEWDVLWKEIQAENDLKTIKDCDKFLTSMVIGITSVMSEMEAIDPQYSEWQTFVHLVFDEWQYYDNLLNEFND